METLTVQDKIIFTDDQVTLIKKQIAPKASNDELQLFLYQAKRTGLDPLTRQIYCIHRAGKMSIQTSIDGFRVIAERSGDYGGQDEPEFIEKDGKLIGCKVAVYKFRGDQRYKASVGVAYWDEYCPKDNDFMWKKMPRTMISKVAEALGLRKAYPQDLSGLYTTEEMQQADGKAEPIQESEKQPGVVEKTLDELHTEYMGLLNTLCYHIGEEANQYHPDNWRGERNITNYKKAISDMTGKVSRYELSR